MGIRDVLHDLIGMLIGLLLGTTGPGWFFRPILIIVLLLRFFRWVVTNTRGGPDLDTMTTEAAESRRQLGQAPARIRSAIRRRY
jgi:hypothetical protein